MQQSQDTVLFTTLSGMVGGISKAVYNSPVEFGLTSEGMIEVSGYAVLSAVVGYTVKFGMDKVVSSLRKDFQKRRKS